MQGDGEPNLNVTIQEREGGGGSSLAKSCRKGLGKREENMGVV